MRVCWQAAKVALMARRTVLDHILRSTSLQLQGFAAQEQRLLRQLSSSAQLSVPQGPALQSVLSWAAGIPLPDDAGKCSLYSVPPQLHQAPGSTMAYVGSRVPGLRMPRKAAASGVHDHGSCIDGRQAAIDQAGVLCRHCGG